MSELSDLYQEVILDHNRKPRNFMRLDGANRQAEGFNPLCGDKVTVYIKLENGVIQEVSFEGSGCAISKASSSIMTTVVKGKTLAEAERLFERFHRMVTGKGGRSSDAERASDSLRVSGPPGGSGGARSDPPLDAKLEVFAGVSEFPSRVKCAILAWHTLKAALEGKGETVSTEKESGAERASDSFRASGPQGGSGGARSDPPLKQRVIDALKTCYDPEIPINIHEMGLIYDLSISPEGAVAIKMTLTSPACPVAGSLPPEVETKVKEIEGVTSVKVEVVWDPPWRPEMMSEAARLQLGIM